jgi:hypothetical protein
MPPPQEVAHLEVPLQPGYKLDICEVVGGALLVRQHRCRLRIIQASPAAAQHSQACPALIAQR